MTGLACANVVLWVLGAIYLGRLTADALYILMYGRKDLRLTNAGLALKKIGYGYERHAIIDDSPLAKQERENGR